ncbi:hypothetical protein LCGC14_0510410 [marine sediment metagenome]|uniref:Uncharacterized protein n=1 Tax=marine sediment metagenome TaxID=412755 RepID=A0A0F9S1K9_9ZZZZ
MAGASLLATTLPTVVSMGVTSQAITHLFPGEKRGRATARTGRIVTVGVAKTKINAEKFATKYRKALRKKDMPYIGRVKVTRLSGGYTITYRRG